MTIAFCISCGAKKPNPHTKCKGCGFKPATESDIVKSVWLSSFRVLEEDPYTENIPTEAELKLFASKIEAGQNPSYPETEIAILTNQYAMVREKPLISPLWFGFAFLILPIIAIIVFFIEQ